MCLPLKPNVKHFWKKHGYFLDYNFNLFPIEEDYYSIEECGKEVWNTKDNLDKTTQFF